MKSTTYSSCPIHASSKISHTITFEAAAKPSIFGKWLSHISECLSRLSFKSIRNAWWIGSQNDLSNTLIQAWQPGSIISKFQTPTGTLYITADTTLIRAIFQNPRSDCNGVFFDHENATIFINGILNDVYPNEIKNFGIENVTNLLVLSAEFKHAKSIRSVMMGTLGATSIKKSMPEINAIADNILTSLTAYEKEGEMGSHLFSLLV